MFYQDKYDDIIVGMKSTALKFGPNTPVCLGCFATLMLSCLTYSGWMVGQSLPYFTSLAIISAHLSHQVRWAVSSRAIESNSSNCIRFTHWTLKTERTVQRSFGPIVGSACSYSLVLLVGIMSGMRMLLVMGK